jgi:hypothetical protein
MFPITMECATGSALPTALMGLGYGVRSLGKAEKLIPITETVQQNDAKNTVTRQHVTVGAVEMWEVRLP